MISLWNNLGVPHKGWVCVDVDDVGEDYATCEMCGNERIRYVHSMTHPEYEQLLRVGCVCAEKMSDDYVTPRKKESALRRKAARKKNWLSRTWRLSARGNYYLNAEGWNVTIFRSRSRTWCFCVSGTFSKENYPTFDAAALAAFEVFWKKINGP